MDEESDRRLTALFVKHYAKLFRMARSIVRNDEDAADLTMDVLSVACRKYKAVLAHPEPQSWFFKTLRLNASNFLKKKKVRDKRNAPDVNIELITVEDQHNLLTEYGGGLSESERNLLYARYVKQQSYEEIAAELGISVSAVGMRLKRTQAHVKENLNIDKDKNT